MRVISNMKAVSTIITILLIIIAAITGGILSYMFTISQFSEIPTGTTLTITDVYINKENARSFKIGVLNPSYSPTDARITRIALSLKGESELYDVVETVPSIKEGAAVRIGESLNITCFKIQKEGFDVVWGDIAAEFPGRTIILHVFSPDSPASNIEATLPYVKVDITAVAFDPNISFGNFSATIKNLSEIDLTINDIQAPSIELTQKSPELPYTLVRGENISFTGTGNWSTLAKSKTTLPILVYTTEGYSFSKNVELPVIDVTIRDVIFDENYTDHFNVTMFNLAMQPSYVNVTRILYALDDGTTFNETISLIGVESNSTKTFKIDWNWKEYRGRTVNVTAYFLQDSQTDTFTVKTPSPIILKVLNENEVFSLQDRTHFNITLKNHQSSLNAVNITKIIVQNTGEEINGTLAIPQIPSELIEPDKNTTFRCTISDWKDWAGKNFTLKVYAAENQTSANYTFQFLFVLPFAELNITEVTNTEFSVTKYLNITVESLDYSIWNLTVSKVTIKLLNQTVLANDTAPENQTIIKPGETAVILWLFDWGKYPNTDIAVTIITKEGAEASTTFHIP